MIELAKIRQRVRDFGFFLLFALLPFVVWAAETSHFAGKSLAEALIELSTAGLQIVFTTEIVRAEMRVAAEPVSTVPRQVLDELLVPHDLTVREGPRGALVVVHRTSDEHARAVPRVAIEESVVVTPSRVSMLREEPGVSVGFTREQIATLPHLGDDFLRAIPLAPGIASNDISARFNVRGGRRDETQILLDGQELYEAYHLQDFDSALSLVASAALGSAELSTGGFPAEYGDRMAGVLDMRTVTPDGAARGRVGVSALSLQAAGSGGFDDGRASWLVEARRGTIDLVQKLLGNEDPQYSDLFTKLARRLDDRNTLAFRFLYSNDAFRFAEAPGGEIKSRDTRYRTGYFWITHRAILSDRVSVDTAVSWAVLDRDRRGEELEDTVQFDVRDERRTDVFGLRQGWGLAATRRHFVKCGFELRAFETDYDYEATFAFDDPLAAIRDSPTAGTNSFAGRFEDEHVSLHAADQVRVTDPLTIELGLRYDRHTLTDEAHVSPRLNAVWSLDAASTIRLAWGRYLQSQRSHELQIEDGEQQFHTVERSEHRVVGFDRAFGSVPLRVEIYERRVENPRARYENLYEAQNTFPELEPDRVRIAPTESLARGVETFLSGRIGERIGWFANYAYARTEDEIEGGRDIARSIDQRHALNLDLDARIGRQWRLNLAWRYHSGWPTTPLALEETKDERGNLVYVPVLGRLNSERLPSYHRLDLRLSREFQVRGGRLELFADVQNVYDRKNTAGFDIAIDDELGTIDARPEYWAGVLPSVGLNFRF